MSGKGKHKKTLKEHATEKVEQGRFQLGLLKREKEKVVRPTPIAFKAHLDAFLDAVYHATNAVKKQAKKLGLPKWGNGVISSEHANFLESILGLRGAEAHELGAAIDLEEKAVPAEGVPGFYPSSLGLPPELAEGQERRNRELGLPPGTHAWIYKIEHRFKKKGEVVKACERCFSILDSLVKGFPWPS